MDGNPNMTDPRRGQLLIDMLQDPAAGGSTIKDLPDADVITASLTTNSVRVLMWNGNWVRLCTTNASCVPTGSTGASSAGATVLPVGSTASTPSASELCLLFRKGGQTIVATRLQSQKEYFKVESLRL